MAHGVRAILCFLITALLDSARSTAFAITRFPQNLKMEETLRTLGPYKLIKELGRGAFGDVWLAERQTAIATTRVALKLPRDEDIDPEAFKREAAIWLQASGHPNVLPMIEADIYDEQVVIVSEYAPDGSLAAWLRQHDGRAPSIEAAGKMIDGVLAGLAHLHERQIIHRDLKPGNILLQGGIPRLADFGLSRLLLSSMSVTVSGTPAYMAPEAFNGKRNEQTDIWSVGVILYRLLAGRQAYNHRDFDSMGKAVMQDNPAPLPEFVPEVLRAVVMKALQREPANRYATAREMQRDVSVALHRIWIEEPSTLQPPTLQPEPPSIETQPHLVEPPPIKSPPIKPPPQPIELLSHNTFDERLADFIKAYRRSIETQPPPIKPPPVHQPASLKQPQAKAPSAVPKAKASSAILTKVSFAVPAPGRRQQSRLGELLSIVLGVVIMFHNSEPVKSFLQVSSDTVQGFLQVGFDTVRGFLNKQQDSKVKPVQIKTPAPDFNLPSFKPKTSPTPPITKLPLSEDYLRRPATNSNLITRPQTLNLNSNINKLLRESKNMPFN